MMIKQAFALCVFFLFAWVAPASAENTSRTVIIVTSAPGASEYEDEFRRWLAVWEKAAHAAQAKTVQIGVAHSNEKTDADQLRQILENEPKEEGGDLWLVLLGHGSFDGKSAKFNLRDADVSADELKSWLQPFRRRIAIIDVSSSSGPFLKALSAPNRVVITATRSGREENYARLGGYLSSAVAGETQASNDLDKDGQISLLEAWLSASREVSEWYRTHNRLATEHSLLDDNGDGLGTAPEAFRGMQATGKPKTPGAALDGALAKQFFLTESAQEQNLSPKQKARRDELESAIAKLRQSKDKTPEEKYYRQLETLLIELARLYESAEKAGRSKGARE